MSDKEQGLGDFQLPSREEIERMADKVIKGLSDLREELGRNHEEFNRNIRATKIVTSFLMKKKDGIERRKKIMDEMSDDELLAAHRAFIDSSTEIGAYRAMRVRLAEEI